MGNFWATCTEKYAKLQYNTDVWFNFSLINNSHCIFQASYGVEDPEFAITQLAQTTMRSEIGKIQLDTVFRERELLNIAIVG